MPSPIYLETPEGRALTSVLSSVSAYFKVLFDQGRGRDTSSGWTGDSFRLIPPVGRKDLSSNWKAISDQCHGASSLLRTRGESDGKCQRTLSNVIRDFEKVDLQDDPWMLVYLWRSILYLRGISFRLEGHKSSLPSALLGPQNDHLVGNALSGFAIFIAINQGREHAMVRCLHALRTFSLVTMKLALERVCDMVVNLFRNYLGDSHPVVLSMTGHFLKYWPRKLGEYVLPSYDRLVRHSEAAFGPRDERTITFLTDYMYTTHYHAHDDSLTYTLALDLWERTNTLGPVPQWGKETYAHTLASKILARLDRNGGNAEGWQSRLGVVARKLRDGDRKCQTRALQLQVKMADWYQKAGDKDRAQGKTKIAEDIRERMRYLALTNGGWRENLPFRRA
ncbi:hypothetical protein CSOJ01_03747 [Colletotrichum sojae]|uniref:Uncharacterized protein n=1 Tax=Colletotrichum sojae TaxID=2175907 RepID=A0A8H6JKP9_9PEZI|nr:hypothetical protein CSOJ01_03747 [Colletotrichum sojae]